MSYLKAVLEEVEKAMILQTARHCRTKTQLAKELGISLRDLYHKLKKHGLEAIFEERT